MGSAKSYAGNIIQDDKFLSIVATAGSFAGIFRFLWAISLEKFNFKATYGFCLVIMIILSLAVPMVMEANAEELESGGFTYQDSQFMVTVKKVLYSVSVFTVSMCMGCHYVLYPVILAKIYGTHGGVQAYMVGFVFHGVGSMTNTIGVKLLFNKVGFKGMSFIWGAFCFFSLILLLCVYKGSKTK